MCCIICFINRDNQVEGESKEALQGVCKLLKVSPIELEHVLTFKPLRTMAPGGKVETYEVPQNPAQAAAKRDAIAKSLYSR